MRTARPAASYTTMLAFVACGRSKRSVVRAVIGFGSARCSENARGFAGGSSTLTAPGRDGTIPPASVNQPPDIVPASGTPAFPVSTYAPPLEVAAPAVSRPEEMAYWADATAGHARKTSARSLIAHPW